MSVKHWSGDSSCRIGAYQVKTSWDENEVTWKVRRTATNWAAAGGDLGTKLTEKAVCNAAGTKVSFDITPLVQQAVSGAWSLGDIRALPLSTHSSMSESWRAYHTSYDASSSARPTLRVTYGSSTTTATTTSDDGRKVLRVLHYNIGKNGWGTDGRYDPNRIVSVVAKVNPDIISFNEVERWNSYSQGADGVALTSRCSSRRPGALVRLARAGLRRLGRQRADQRDLFEDSLQRDLPAHLQRRQVEVGRRRDDQLQRPHINFMTTHFDPYTAGTGSPRRRSRDHMKGFAENRIVAGDFNDQPGNPPITTMTAAYYDAWAEAKKAGIAYSPPDNPNGYTRNSRIDYIFYSRAERNLTLKKVQVVETRSSSGVMPSDHRPLVAEFLVQ